MVCDTSDWCYALFVAICVAVADSRVYFSLSRIMQACMLPPANGSLLAVWWWSGRPVDEAVEGEIVEVIEGEMMEVIEGEII